MILGLIGFLVNGDNYAASPVLINLANDLNVSIDTAALTATFYMLTFGLFTILMGPLGDRYGKPLIVFIAALGTSFFSVLCVFSTNIQTLIILRAVNGGFASGILPVSIALIGEISPQQEKQNSIARIMSMMFLGGAVATTIGGALAYFGSWKLVYLVYGVAELVLAIVSYRYLKNIDSTKRMSNILQLYKSALSNKSLLRILILMFLMGFCVLGSFVYTGKLVESKTGLNVFLIGILLGAFGLGTVVAGRKVGNIRSQLGLPFFIISGLLGFVSLITLVGFSSILTITITLFAFGSVFISLHSSFVTTAQSLLPDLRGTVMALASFSVVVGGSIGTFINGKILTLIGINGVYYFSAILLILASLLAYIFFKQISLLNLKPAKVHHINNQTRKP